MLRTAWYTENLVKIICKTHWSHADHRKCQCIRSAAKKNFLGGKCVYTQAHCTITFTTFLWKMRKEINGKSIERVSKIEPIGCVISNFYYKNECATAFLVGNGEILRSTAIYAKLMTSIL